MSCKLTVCGVCDYRNTNKPSVVWCSECDEGLCEGCKEHHASSKATRDHGTVLISEYQKLPSNILEITQTCPIHNAKYVLFCKKHDSPCCSRCFVETHNDCKDLNAIDDVIQNVKSSNAFLEIEQILTELSENFQRIRKDRQENIKSLTENKMNIEKEVHQTRILINNHLDKLQESLMKELYVAEEKENKKISNLVSSIQEKEKEITECKITLDKIKQHASDLQTFLALKHIQRDVRNNEQFLESFIKEENTNHVSITWKNETAVETLPTTIKKIGTIIMDIRSVDSTLTNRKNKQAQIMMPITYVPIIDDLTPTLKQAVKTIGSDISSCCLLPDGRMIFSCYGRNKIDMFKPNGTLDFTLETGLPTSHINFMEESQKLVVTSGFYHQCIKIINVTNRKIDKSIYVGTKIYEIVHKDGKFFYNGEKQGLRVVNLDDGSVTQLVDVSLSQYGSIAMWSDQLYFLNNDDSVTCCDLQGAVKWKFENKAFLQTARSITVDNYGRVYVAGCRCNKVIVISPDGSTHRLILSKKDDLKGPQTLFFERKSNKLLIANSQNDAFIYDVSK